MNTDLLVETACLLCLYICDLIKHHVNQAIVILMQIKKNGAIMQKPLSFIIELAFYLSSRLAYH